MNSILSVAIIALLASTLFVLVRWGNERCLGPEPVSLFTFLAILFTSGLDMGLIIFPLTEFPVYAKEAAYQFANPLAVEFGFWGFLIWAFYFITTFYFCVIEPRVKFFELRPVKIVNNLVIVATCAFTAYLFLVNIAWYAPELGDTWSYLVVLAILLAAAYSSTDIKYLKVLSVASTWLFFALIGGMWLMADIGLSYFSEASTAIASGYFANLHKFVLPLSDYHAFYLFWWFAWSVMIGQFVARFVGGIKTYQLLLALLVIPSIPLAVWFSVLYYYFANAIEITLFWKLAMVTVGVIFVINSVDSLVRLYTDNLGISVEKLGRSRFILLNVVVLATLVLLFKFTPFEIQWVGLIVIALYAAAIVTMALRHRPALAAISQRATAAAERVG
ncbi:choline-glycine betaine transporter [Pseudomonas sp. SJZ079]|uniref:BCCT family transporter n=1 Tax=Pseudomonas sp. SJZ079 TaxID=2572887 RepID=UPI00119A38A5|nr:BCCT family transporter [Pseudomonas sp. SJZ079]TWC39600.1 choline-glycine betaine transporter [Pseudomonas sp. SJZ079]